MASCSEGKAAGRTARNWLAFGMNPSPRRFYQETKAGTPSTWSILISMNVTVCIVDDELLLPELTAIRLN